jgi:NADH:ubiquinone oxidoreductase subunit F (NADH-binding)
MGGGAGGLFFKKNELDKSSNRLGSIKVFNAENFNWKKEMGKISEFLMYGNCDRCTPCREGVYRINEMIKNDEFNKDIFNDLILVMEKSSQCPLGRIAAEAFKSLERL